MSEALELAERLRRYVMGIGSAISRRSWHDVEMDHARIRDEIEPALRSQDAERTSLQARIAELEWGRDKYKSAFERCITLRTTAEARVAELEGDLNVMRLQRDAKYYSHANEDAQKRIAELGARVAELERERDEALPWKNASLAALRDRTETAEASVKEERAATEKAREACAQMAVDVAWEHETEGKWCCRDTADAIASAIRGGKE